MTDLPEDIIDKVYEAVELARTTGKIKKGVNEVTKAVEKGTAKLVVIAKDVSPAEITMHIPLLCKDKGILCAEIPSKDTLGAAAGIGLGTAGVAIIVEGESKATIAEISKNLG